MLRSLFQTKAFFTPGTSASGMTRAERAAMGKPPPSFTDKLPYVDYQPATRSFLLEDGVSKAAVFELTPTQTEGRTDSVLERQAAAIQNAVNGSFPEHDLAEWVVQVFVQDDPKLDMMADELSDYIAPPIRATQYTQDFLKRMGDHLRRISQPGGLFQDDEVTGIRFRGQRRRVRTVIYRRYPKGYNFNQDGIGPDEHLRNICDRYEQSLAAGGITARRYDGKDFYEWLLPWFNPAPGCAPNGAAELLKVAPYPGDDDIPYGRDYAEMLTLSMPRSDLDKGFWYFDEMPHMALTFQALRSVPKIGHFTAERRFDNGKHFALFDNLPEGAVLSMTVTIRPQDKVRDHVSLMRKAATGDSAEAQLTRENCEDVARRMAQGDKLFPCNIVIQLRGKDEQDLRRKANQVNAQLLPSGIKLIDRQQDLLALDAYLKGLPMAFDPVFDAKEARRGRLVFSSHIARLLPLYGRARGTGKPGFWFFNRGGEPLLFDPLHKLDRKKNAHMLILGPTGAGKSAMLNYLAMLVMAIYRPRLFIVDAGNSFGLLGDHFKKLGVTVNQVTLNPNTDVSLPPFADAFKMLDQMKRPNLSVPIGESEEDLPELDDAALEEIDDKDENRDILGEEEIAARIMITGGDERENAKLSRADRFLIRRAIIEAAKKARDVDHKKQLLTEDVAEMLLDLSKDESLPQLRRDRANEMGMAMKLFCDGLPGKFFNRPGQSWPDTDVTILEMGILAREGYEDQLTVAYLSFMNHINALVEAKQHDARPAIVLTDEGHIVTTNPLLSPFVVKITKMWRKLGTWFWLATQNMGDFPDAAKRMLNMMEWWLCLTMPKEEIEQLARFRELNDETTALLLSARKSPGKFTEGVVLTDTFEALFRNVPPPLPLALAMTEKDEKAQRAEIMRERGCTELEAAYVVADQIEAVRG